MIKIGMPTKQNSFFQLRSKSNNFHEDYDNVPGSTQNFASMTEINPELSLDRKESKSQAG
jgi:hypothetical protein